MLKGEKVIDRGARYFHTARIAYSNTSGPAVTLRRYAKSTRRVADEMTVPIGALQEVLLDEELLKARRHA
jgi:hypothetical protein